MAISSRNGTKPTSKNTTESTDPKSQPNRSTDPDFDEVLEGLSDSIAWFLSRPAALYKWMTAPHGGQRIILSALTLYWWAVSAEAYWQALGEGQNFIHKGTAIKHEPFVPKPFSPNSGNLQNAGQAFADPSFYVTAIISLAILGVQANLQRGKKSIGQAKRDYESVKNFRVGEVHKDAIDIVEVKAKEYKESGTHQAKQNAELVKASYLVDIAGNAGAYAAYLATGQLGAIVASAVWIYGGVFGAEKFLGLWQQNEDALKRRGRSLKFPHLLKGRAKPTEQDVKAESN
jgi:hypothetical protein